MSKKKNSKKKSAQAHKQTNIPREGRCMKCGRHIRNINKNFNIEWPNGRTVNCCSKECFDELSDYKTKTRTEKMAFIAQVAFGLAGIVAVFNQLNVAAQIFIFIDAILLFLFPHAIFNPKFKTSYDEARRQSRSIAISLIMFAVIWFYFLYRRMGI